MGDKKESETKPLSELAKFRNLLQAAGIDTNKLAVEAMEIVRPGLESAVKVTLAQALKEIASPPQGD